MKTHRFLVEYTMIDIVTYLKCIYSQKSDYQAPVLEDRAKL